MSSFISLASLLEGSFEKSINELSDEHREWVEDELDPEMWDTMTAFERQCSALLRDYRKDPSKAVFRDGGRDYMNRDSAIQKKIQLYESCATPTANDLRIKDESIAAFQRERTTLAAEHARWLAGFDENGHPIKAPKRSINKMSAAPIPGSGPAKDMVPKTTVRREARKLKTQEMYISWNVEYRRLKALHPDKSDPWCAQQIKKNLNVPKSAATIRRQLVK